LPPISQSIVLLRFNRETTNVEFVCGFNAPLQAFRLLNPIEWLRGANPSTKGRVNERLRLPAWTDDRSAFWSRCFARLETLSPKRQTPRIPSRRFLPAFRLPTRLAVGFGLDALEASGLIHPGRWQAVTESVPPLLGAED